MKEKIISERNLDLVFQCNDFSQFSNKLKDTKTKLIFESIFWEKVFLSWINTILKKADYEIDEKDKNIFYVEGYSLDRLAKGEIALKRVKQQKIGIIFDSAIESEILVRHLQVADACVSTLGINVHSYVITKKPLNIVIDSDSSKISGGTIENPDILIDAGKCLIEKGVTAIAIVAKFPDDPDSLETNIYREGKGIDPIAGVEAVISHLIS